MKVIMTLFLLLVVCAFLAALHILRTGQDPREAGQAVIDTVRKAGGHAVAIVGGEPADESKAADSDANEGAAPTPAHGTESSGVSRVLGAAKSLLVATPAVSTEEAREREETQ